jgi:hypothetical protein
MKALFKKLATFMTAAAFAEAGEFETARQIVKEEQPRKKDRRLVRKHQRPNAENRLRAD